MEGRRVLIVDGRVVGLNAGWKIPNSARFYGAIGLHDYSLPDLGAILYLEDLIWMKEQGYKEADTGGSDTTLLKFKSQFGRAASQYKTHIFSITKKN